MKNIIDELKASYVLTKDEIERIKLYVIKKYPNNSSKENAMILSKTIYGVIDRNLEGISGEEKRNIRKNIITSSILKNKKNILKWDVFDAYITESKENPKLKKNLIEWINKNQKNNVSQEIFEEYVMSIHNTKGVCKASCLDIKLQPKNNVIKYFGLSNYKFNFKNVILKYKRQAIAKIYSTSKKINIKLEAVSNKISSTKIALCLLSLLILTLYSLNNLVVDNKVLGANVNNEKQQFYVKTFDTYDLYVKDAMSYHPHLPDNFNYKSIDKGKLLEFLNTKNSILAEEPYFSAIIRTSKEFNLNPHILFAITGQEQSFVPKDHENAEKIANNPFNVFHSWKEYNTDIYDSSRIVARTVINLSMDKPANTDMFEWINNKYAYDKNWGSGVKQIFETLGKYKNEIHFN
jgi:putative ABC transport system permease protein